MKIHSLISFRNIRRQNLPYIAVWILYYAWVIVFTTWWTASPLTDGVYGTETRTMVHSVNLIASAVLVCLFKREWFAWASKIGAVCLAASLAVFLTAKNPSLRFGAAFVLAVSMGCVNVAILSPFVFVLNNTEKFYSVVFSNVLISALVLAELLDLASVTSGAVFSSVMLCVSVAPIIFFRKRDMAAAYPENFAFVPKINKFVYFTVFLNCVYAVLCKGVGKMFLLSAARQTLFDMEPLFYAGAVGGCALYYAGYVFLKNSNQFTWNVTFSAFVTSMLLYVFCAQNNFAMAVFAVLLGVSSTMGMINIYYILGVIGKKYFSIKYVRVSIILIGICGGLSGLTLGSWASASPAGAGIAAAVISAITMVILLSLSPWLTRAYFSDKWAEDSKMPDVNTEKYFSKFDEYGLSKREREICMLLLKGYTMRQSGSVLDISYATVNTYCTSLYRKLDINSRTELLVLFKDHIAAAAGPPKDRV